MKPISDHIKPCKTHMQPIENPTNKTLQEPYKTFQNLDTIP